MNRKETTKFLSELLERDRLQGAGKYWAKEVTLDYGKTELTPSGYKSKVRRIDYLQFVPKNQLSASGIEKGEFICYEVKSCKADFLSGHGQNFIGEKNFFVMTMETYKELKACGEIDKLDYKIGILVAIPKKLKYKENPFEIKFCTHIDLVHCDDWSLIPIKQSKESYRERSMVELLFCMVRSQKHRRV